jgi:ribosomal protein S18 acetylase RimI-like enzyme
MTIELPGTSKLRQFGRSVNQRGLVKTLYWAAFGYLRPNRFILLANDLTAPPPGWQPAGPLTFAMWTADEVRAWRRNRHGLPLEFFQDEIDGARRCAVAFYEHEVAGLIWVYSAGDSSRLYRLAPGEADLNYGCILPAYRFQGAFSGLLAHACDTLRREDYHVAYAAVHSTNIASLKAFRKVGFREIATVWHFLVYRPKIAPHRLALAA